MYFELAIDYYSNEANKNKYTDFQLIALTKNKLKIAEDQIEQGIVLATTFYHTLLLGLESTCCYLKENFSSASYVCFSSIFISTRYM